MTHSRTVWINGNYVPESEARISIYDSALMFGDMVFEMTRSFGKKQFEMMPHLERLYDSMKWLQINEPMPITDMEGLVLEVIDKNDPAFEADDEHRVLINVSRGTLGIYQEVLGTGSGPTLVIADFPLRWTVRGMGRMFDGCINLVVTSQRAVPAELIEPKVKNRSRMHYMMASIEASAHKGEDNWALMLDPDGFVAEGTGYNVFMVKNGRLLTPEPRNILRGISRDTVIRLALELGIPVDETNIEPFDVAMADEVFVTATPFCMLPATRFNHQDIGNGSVGPVFTKILNAWSEAVGVSIDGQIKEWDAANIEAQSVKGPTPYKFSRS